jgi:hypothetical protein
MQVYGDLVFENKRPKEKWIEIEVPALVERKVWETAQELREQNKQFSNRNAKHDYFLSGLIRCACGKAMSGEFFLVTTDITLVLGETITIPIWRNEPVRVDLFVPMPLK